MHMVLDEQRMMSCLQTWHRLCGARCGVNENRRAALIKQFWGNLDNSLLISPTATMRPEVDEEIKRRKYILNATLNAVAFHTRVSHRGKNIKVLKPKRMCCCRKIVKNDTFELDMSGCLLNSCDSMLYRVCSEWCE